jgi:hypothetical protein
MAYCDSNTGAVIGNQVISCIYCNSRILEIRSYLASTATAGYSSHIV